MLFYELVGLWPKCSSVFAKTRKMANLRMKSCLDQQFSHVGSSVIYSEKDGPKFDQNEGHHELLKQHFLKLQIK
jgi:hypothetical protein